MPRLVVPLFLSLLPALPAQDPLARLPKQPLLRFECDGPAGWRAKLGATNVAAALADRQVQDSMQPLWTQLEAVLAEGKRATGQDVPALWSQWVDYGGRIVGTLDLEPMPADGSDPRFELVVVMGPDGKTDLGRIAEQLTAISESEPGLEMRDLEVAGRRLRVAGDDDVTVAQPFLLDGHLVLLAGTQLEPLAGRFLAAAPDAGGTVSRPASGPLSLHVHVPRMFEWLARAAEEDETAEVAQQVLEVLGLHRIDALTFDVGAIGPHVSIDAALALQAGENLLFDLLRPAAGASLQSGLDYAPLANENWSVHYFRGSGISEVFRRVVGTLEEQTGMSHEQMTAAFQEATGVRLKEDLLDHLGEWGGMTSLDAERAADLPEDPITAAMPFHALWLTLRDGAAFSASIDKMLRESGLHAARKSEEYQGVKVHELMAVPFVELSYAITDRLVVLGIGPAGAAALRQVLAEERGRQAGRAQAELDAETQRFLRQAGGTPVGLSSSAVRAQFELVLQAIEEEHDPDFREVQSMLPVVRAVIEALDRSGAKRILSLSTWQENKLLNRAIW